MSARLARLRTNSPDDGKDIGPRSQESTHHMFRGGGGGGANRCIPYFLVHYQRRLVSFSDQFYCDGMVLYVAYYLCEETGM